MYERWHMPLLPRRKFLLRFLRHAAIASGLVVVSLAIGIVGYHWICGLPWLDSLLNASMILTGMGPVDPMKTAGAKLFASFYALFSGVMFLTMAAVLFAPLIHRLLHRFHLDLDDGDSGSKVAPRPRHPVPPTRKKGSS